MRLLLFTLVGLGVLFGLFQLFKPADEPTAAPQAAERAVLAAPEPVLEAAPPDSPGPDQTTAAPTTGDEPAPVQASGPRRHVVDLRVGDSGLLSGPDLVRIQQDDVLVLRIESEVRDELHLHGYDRHLHLAPGKTAELEIEASLSGRFDYELHKRHHDLGVIEVMPH